MRRGANERDHSIFDIGQQNIEFVLAFVKEAKLLVRGTDLGDVLTRKVYYFPATGQVLVKKLNALPNSTVLDREQAYRRRLSAGVDPQAAPRVAGGWP